MAYSFDFPIKTPAELGKLRARQFSVDRERTRAVQTLMEEVMGDILPVKVGNYDPFRYEFACGEYGDFGFTGNFFSGLTWQLYRFIGNEGLLYWVYDAPEAIHELMRFMLEDRISLFGFMESEGLLAANTDSQMAGPRAYGYVSELAPPGTADPNLGQLWGWAESQESESLSQKMYAEFMLPYLAALAKHFGLVYYGCCERVDDRLELIIDAIPNLRSVYVSGWSNLTRCAEIMGPSYVYSRKPTPAHISGVSPNWALLEKDMRDTQEATAANHCNIEILFQLLT